MAEVEFGGLKFSGGKMVALLTALSTLGGAAWGGFEIYKDYMDMKEIIQNIDTDAIAARNDIIETKLFSITFVASKRPPKPTSRIVRSALFS